MEELMSVEITLEEKMNILADARLRFTDLKNSFDRETADLQEAIKGLEEEIKAEVIKIGETVKTEHISAIYCKGKETWDGKLLTGYAVAHPEILAAKKVGQPTVSFRLAK